MLKRSYSELNSFFKNKKIIIIYGARRIGKTTLLESYLKTCSKKYKFVSGDDILIQEVLSSSNIQKITEFCQNYELLVIDEAQNIPNVGQGLKIIVDYVPSIQVIATGSSSFDLANKLGEPLVGRKVVLTMFPLSQQELSDKYNPYELKQNLEDYLIYGSYPEVLTLASKNDKIQYLKEIVGSYLYKDILSFCAIKNPLMLHRLTKLLAFQIGSEVSFNELSNNLGLDVKTVSKYIDLLEKSFIIYKLTGYSENLRNEVSKKHKYYFVDNGIRNAVISQFNTLEDRNDVGHLWENFILMERIKKNTYDFSYVNSYFWRTYNKDEVDYLEESDGALCGYEFKWSANAKTKTAAFLREYKNATIAIVDKENYLSFVA